MSQQLAQAFPPGDFLAEELEARGWSQADFAEIVDRPAQLVSGIVSGRKEITRETASQIAAALGTSIEYWLKLQYEYQLWLQAQDSETTTKLDRVRLRAQMNEYAPLSLLKKRGIITAEALEEQREQLLSLLGVGSLEERPRFFAAARRTNVDKPVTGPQFTWLACARRKAQDVAVAVYDLEALRVLAEGLTQTIREAKDWLKLPDLLAGAGVRLVYVEAFPSNKVSGFSFLLEDDPNNPVIALSGLGKRFDKVMFTLLHEIAHLVLGHVRPNIYLVDEGEDASTPDENAANALAAKWCVPLPMNPPHMVKHAWVTTESLRQGVHPLMVVGALQHEGFLDWRTDLARGGDRVEEYLQSW